MAADNYRTAQDCWKQGVDALGRSEWDYAIWMFRESVRLVPENRTFRETLRGALAT